MNRKRYFILFLIILLAIFLRFYKLGSVPVSLHGDEAGVGYNAFSLLKYGLDEYVKPWPLIFRADVAPIIFYSTIPTIALFGTTEFAVRLPSAIVGTISVIVFYYLVRELLINLSENLSLNKINKISLICSLLLGISPWHVQISRIVHDASYGLLLQFLGLILFLKFVRLSKPSFFYLSILIFGSTFYAYHGPRLTTPLVLIILITFFRKKLSNTKIILSAILFSLIISPIMIDFATKPLSQTRFGGINIFVRENTQSSYITFSLPFKLVQNYLNQFNLQQLFFDTSASRYFNLQWVGLLYLFSSLFLTIGVIKISKYPRLKRFLFCCVAIAVLPGALTQGPPNVGRIALLLPFLEIIIGVGLYYNFQKKNLFKLTKIILLIFIYFNIYFFLYQYFIDSPKRFATVWQSGAKDMALNLLHQENKVQTIIVSDKIKQAYIYILFYGQKNPRWIIASPYKRNSFIGYDAFANYQFRTIRWNEDHKLKNVLLVGAPDDIPQTTFPYQSITTVNNQEFVRMVKL